MFRGAEERLWLCLLLFLSLFVGNQNSRCCVRHAGAVWMASRPGPLWGPATPRHDQASWGAGLLRSLICLIR